MAYATWRHSCGFLPPSTRTVMNLVAPSPSRTMAWASCRETSCIAAFSARPEPLSNDVMGACATLLLAITTNESLVEVSPSTVTRLNDPSANSSASWCIKP